MSSYEFISIIVWGFFYNKINITTVKMCIKQEQ